MKEELIREWTTVGEIHRELGFDKSAILRCCKGKQQRSYWFIWRFKDEVETLKKEVENEGKSEVVPFNQTWTNLPTGKLSLFSSLQPEPYFPVTNRLSMFLLAFISALSV